MRLLGDMVELARTAHPITLDNPSTAIIISNAVMRSPR